MRINDLGNTATDFASDDYIAIDGTTNGSRKMPSILFKNTIDAIKSLSDSFVFSEYAGYLHINGNLTANTSYHSVVSDVRSAVEGDEFYYRGIGRGSFASAVFYNREKSVIGYYVSGQDKNIITYKKITCPAGTCFVRFSSCDVVANKVYLEVYKKNSFDIFFDGLYKNYIFYKDSNGTINSSGEIIYSSTYKSIYTFPIKAKEGEKFLYKGVGRTTVCSAIFYNSSGSVIGNAKIDSALFYSYISCPANTDYVIFASFGTSPELSVIKCVSGLVGDGNSINYISRNGYLKNDGTFQDSYSYHCLYTDRISAEEGDVFKYKGSSRSSAVSVIFFSETASIVSYLQIDEPTSYTSITCPANTKFVQFSSFNSSGSPVIFDVYKVGSQIGNAHEVHPEGFKSILDGKNWYACGDSFTYGEFVGYEGEDETTISSGKYAGSLAVYPFLIGNRTNCEVHNIAVSGQTLCPIQSNCFVGNEEYNGAIENIAEDADYITIKLGINDSHNKVPVGTIDDNTKTTFYGCLNFAMDYISTNFPRAKVGLICSNGCDSGDYPEAVKQIAKKWGVSYLDEDAGENCPTLLRTTSRNPASAYLKSLKLTQQKVSNSNLHPNPLAHKLESIFVENWMCGL